MFAWCRERIPPDKFEEWWYQMTQPMPGREKAQPTDAEAEEDAALFMAAMGTLGTQG